MTTAEFDRELDVIYENINKNGAPGLDLYEKSVILTHAQKELTNILLQADPSGNAIPELITSYTIGSPTQDGFQGTRSYVFTLPVDIVKILNEEVIDSISSIFVVLGISNEQLQVKLSKPYKYPPVRRAWRIGLEETTGIAKVEIIPRDAIVLSTYKLRYVRKPTPIILTDLSALTPAETIDGEHAITQCELSTGLHREILKIATTLAEQYYYDKYGTSGDKQ